MNLPIPSAISTNLSIPRVRSSGSFLNSASIAAANPAKLNTIIATPAMAVNTPPRIGTIIGPIGANRGAISVIPSAIAPTKANPVVNIPKSDHEIFFMSFNTKLITLNNPAVATTTAVIPARPGTSPTKPAFPPTNPGTFASIVKATANAVTAPKPTTNLPRLLQLILSTLERLITSIRATVATIAIPIEASPGNNLATVPLKPVNPLVRPDKLFIMRPIPAAIIPTAVTVIERLFTALANAT